VFTFLTYDVVK